MFGTERMRERRCSMLLGRVDDGGAASLLLLCLVSMYKMWAFAAVAETGDGKEEGR